MRILKQNKLFFSIMACMFLLIFSVFFTKMYFVNADDDVDKRITVQDRYNIRVQNIEHLPDGMFPTMAAAGAEYLNNLKGGIIEDSHSVEPSDYKGAAGLIGYTGALHVDTKNVTQSWYAENTINTGRYDYNTLEGIYQQYAGYGIVMNAYGVDQVVSNATHDSMRQMVGLLMMVLYFMSALASKFWDYVLNFMSILNPFVLFGGNYQGSALNGVAGGYISDAAATIRDGVKISYEAIQSLGRSVFLPVVVICAIFMWLVINKASGGAKTLKKLFIRIVFVVLGLPILFSVYSTAIDFVRNVSVDASGVTDGVIGTTFVDFENFAKDTNLCLDKAVSLGDYDFTKGELKQDKLYDVRKKCKEINSMLSDDHKLSFDFDPPAISHDEGMTAYDVAVLETSESSSADNYPKIMNLLERYAAGTGLTPGMYESYVRNNIVGNSSGSTDDWMTKAYMLSDQWEDFVNNRNFDLYVNSDNLLYGETDEDNIRQINYGLYKSDDIKSDISNRFTAASASSKGLNVFWGPCNVDKGQGLSMIGAYNYLSSSFDKDGVTVYSVINTKLDQQSITHMSVNVVGSPYLQVVFILDAITLLLANCIIVYGYGFGLIVSCMKTMLKMVPAIFVGTLGLMTGISKAIIITFGFIIELLITCFLVGVTAIFVPRIYNIMAIPMSIIMKPLCNTIGAGLYPVVSGIVSVIVIAIIVGKLMKYRTAIVSTISDMISSTVSQLIS